MAASLFSFHTCWFGIRRNSPYFFNVSNSSTDNRPDRYSCVISATGLIYIQGSSGANDNFIASYQLQPGASQLQPVDLVGMESYDPDTLEFFDEPRYFCIEEGVKHILTREEAALKQDHYLSDADNRHPYIYNTANITPLLAYDQE